MQQLKNQQSPKVYCIGERQGMLACIRKQCAEQAFICSENSCQCNSKHKKCKMTNLEPIIKRIILNLNNKKINEKQQKSFDIIQQRLNNMIEGLSKIREQLLIAKKAPILQRNSVELYANLMLNEKNKITGKTINEIKKQLFFSQNQNISAVSIDQNLQLGLRMLSLTFKELCVSVQRLFKGYQDISKKIRNIKKSVQQNSQFTTNYWLQQIQFPPIKEVIRLSKLPKLLTIHIPYPKLEKGKDIINNMKTLNHLTLGFDQKRFDRLNQSLIKQMLKLKRLQSLNFIGLDYQTDQKDIITIIRNNKNLKSFTSKNFNGKVPNISDKMIEIMANGVRLKHLMIPISSQITGIHFNNFRYLTRLALNGCSNINESIFIEAIRNMRRLNYLDLHNNFWVIDQTVKQISRSCRRLNFFNISSTSVNGETLKWLQSLKKLQTLICGGYGYKIHGKDLIELTSQLHTIRKLGISSVSINNQQLLTINENCGYSITHLSIMSVPNITVDVFLKMKRLKVINIHYRGAERDQLREAGIEVRPIFRVGNMFDYLCD